MTVKGWCAAASILALGALWGAGLEAQGSGPLIQPSNLVRLGSFKVPTGLQVGSGGAELEYGGTALGYNPIRNSLYITGHDWDQLSEEISIPALGGTATRLQPLADPFEGKVGLIGAATNGFKTGNHFVYNGKLYLTAYPYYDSSGVAKSSHFVRPLDFATKGQVAGPYKVGSLNPDFYSGYMGMIPTAWQSALGGPALVGNCCLNIITRTSYGPAVFAFDPAALGAATAPATALVYYDSAHQTLGAYSSSAANPPYNRATMVTGVVFPEGTSSVLFFGRTGTGPSCYGEGSACNDPVDASKGDHAYPYVSYVWAYDAHDFAAVKAGTKQPWQVVPYATWALNLPDTGMNKLGGAVYDPSTNRIYVSQMHGDDTRPLIQVYTVSNATTTPAPLPPSNVRIVK